MPSQMNGKFYFPSELTVAPQKERRLEVDWADGRRTCLSAEFLRVHSPSIEGLEQDGTRRLISGRKGIGAQSAHLRRRIGNDLTKSL